MQAAAIGDKIRVSLIKRPQFSLKRALQVLKMRGTSDFAIKKFKDICEMHQLVSLEYMEPLSVGLEELIGGISSSRGSKKKV